MKKISVIIPVYKVEKYIHRCVESVRNQEYKNLEILLIDDGSPDNCPQICDDYVENDKRIKVIHQHNQGVSVARNTGLKVATGDYITFIDSDDYIDSNMYQKMMEIIEKYDSEVVMCDCIKEFPDHQEVYTHDIRGGFYDLEQLREEYYPHLLMMENVEYPPTISNWLLLFKNKKKENTQLYYEKGIRYSEDLLFGAKLMRETESFYYMKEQCFYHYCMNENSATHTYVPDKWDDYVKLHSKIKEYFEDDSLYDFEKQIDLSLLFFVYNAIGDILGIHSLNEKVKIERILNILSDTQVKMMFKRNEIRNLRIPVKQKLMTYLLKHKIGVYFLIKYYK